MTGALDLVAGEDVVGVDDAVGVALLGQEALAVGGVVLVEGVAGDDRVEAGTGPGGLGAEHPAQALRLLLPRAVRPRDLDRDGGLRQVDGEVGDLRHHEDRDLPGPERVEQPLPFLAPRLALYHWSVEAGRPRLPRGRGPAHPRGPVLPCR